MITTVTNTINTDLFDSEYSGNFIFLIQKVKEIMVLDLPTIEFYSIDFVELFTEDLNTILILLINSSITEEELFDMGYTTDINYTISN